MKSKSLLYSGSSLASGKDRQTVKGKVRNNWNKARAESR